PPPPSPLPLAGDPVHHGGTLGAFRVSGWCLVLGKSFGRDQDERHYRVPNRTRARSSSALSRASSTPRADSMPASSASRGTSSGSPIASATWAYGFGIWVRSQ